MTVWVRLFTLAAIALFTAQPLMACCLDGHSASATELAQDNTMNCHDSAMPMPASHGSSADPGPNTALDECPGCDDCNHPIMQAQNPGDVLSVFSLVLEIPFATLAAQFPGFAHPPLHTKTGPPGASALPLNTPITLKQRLLI
jgi:hypothetical protein